MAFVAVFPLKYIGNDLNKRFLVTFESQRQKTFLWIYIRPAKIQISLHIHSLIRISLLGAFWIANDIKFLQAAKEE